MHKVFASGCLLSLALAGCGATPRPRDPAPLLAAQRRPVTDGSEALSEERAVELSGTRAPSVRAAKADVEQAEGEASRVSTLAHPELRLDNDYFRKGSQELDRDVYRFGVALRMNLPNWAERSAAMDSADADVSAAQAGLSTERRRVRRAVRAAYAKLSAAHARVALWTQVVEARQKRESSLAKQVAGGHARDADRALAQAQWAEAVDHRDRAIIDVTEAENQLRLSLGADLPPPESVVLGVEPTCSAPSVDLRALQDRAVANSPALAHREAIELRDRESARARRRALLPSFKFVELGYTRNMLLGSAAVTPGYDVEPRYYEWGVHLRLGIDLPLWSPQRGAAAAAEARAEGDTHRMESDVAEITAAIEKDATQWRLSAARAARAKESTIPALERALTGARASADGGGTSLADVLEIEEKVLSARLARIDDLLACRLAQINVEAAIDAR